VGSGWVVGGGGAGGWEGVLDFFSREDMAVLPR